MVNQRLALKTGFVPCSTIKLVTSLARSTEGVVSKNTPIFISRYVSFNLTQALAHSNNQYFTSWAPAWASIVCSTMPNARLRRESGPGYSRRAARILPLEAQNWRRRHDDQLRHRNFDDAAGTGALLGAIANGGTLYYLQYPRTRKKWITSRPK